MDEMILNDEEVTVEVIRKRIAGLLTSQERIVTIGTNIYLYLELDTGNCYQKIAVTGISKQEFNSCTFTPEEKEDE